MVPDVIFRGRNESAQKVPAKKCFVLGQPVVAQPPRYRNGGQSECGCSGSGTQGSAGRGCRVCICGRAFARLQAPKYWPSLCGQMLECYRTPLARPCSMIWRYTPVRPIVAVSDAKSYPSVSQEARRRESLCEVRRSVCSCATFYCLHSWQGTRLWGQPDEQRLRLVGVITDKSTPGRLLAQLWLTGWLLLSGQATHLPLNVKGVACSSPSPPWCVFQRLPTCPPQLAPSENSERPFVRQSRSWRDAGIGNRL